MKKYKIGMYGGKFMPLHKGHNYCIETAAKECEKVYVILFFGGASEEEVLKNNKDEYLGVDVRKGHVINICKNYDMTIFKYKMKNDNYFLDNQNMVNRCKKQINFKK